MSERASDWFLVILVLAQLALLASRVPDPQGHGSNYLEGLFLATAAIPAGWVINVEEAADQAGESVRSRARIQEENRALQTEVLGLREELIRLQGVEAEADRLAAALKYSRSRASALRPADIVYADHSSWLQAIVLRVPQGEVFLHAPVVASSGLVGRVVVARGRYAKVQLLTDRASSVGAMIERSRRQGVVRGRGQALLSMDYLPLRADIRPGDRVVTAGIDGIYPRGLLLGVVVSTKPRPNELFLHVEVAPSVDLGVLDQVYVLEADPVPTEIREALPGESP